MLQTAVIPNLCAIVGHDIDGRKLASHSTRSNRSSSSHSSSHRSQHIKTSREEEEEPPLHDQLVTQGKKWSAHVNETWKVLCLAGIYILITGR